ncbi:hypothetical protein [Clostridium sp. CF012]|uniref:hypothetical protein n=1 Tax=Clostridium sp. CF012 TaxID=2843319 RepID=UPI001C0ACA30|nr:hypothetical protein [Clostridium sp. CF012]MBU3146879.1 hypothetical protein [Clostridium sp. CF012]
MKINTGTSYAIKKANGNNAKLYASVYTLFWDGTSFTLLGEGGDYGTALNTDVISGKTIGTDSGIVVGTIPNLSNGDTNSISTLGTGEGHLYLRFPQNAYYGNGHALHYPEPNFIASNILSGKSVLGLVGNYYPSRYVASEEFNPSNQGGNDPYRPMSTSIASQMSKVGRRLTVNFTGTIRIKFSFSAGLTNMSANGQLYKNGSPFGTLYSGLLNGTNSIDINVNIGDYFETYMQSLTPKSGEYCSSLLNIHYSFINDLVVVTNGIAVS